MSTQGLRFGLVARFGSALKAAQVLVLVTGGSVVLAAGCAGDAGGGGPRPDGGGGGSVDAGDIPSIPGVEPWSPRACGATVACVGAGGSIQDAIDLAPDNSVIQVAAGEFSGSMLISGKSLTIIGGLSSGFDAWDPAANPSIVTAGSGSAFGFTDADGSVLQGFVIRGGGGTCDSDCFGGGVYARGLDMTIAGNVIESGDVGEDGEGGGIYLRGTGAVLSNVVRNNRGGRGAGMTIRAEGTIAVSKNIVRSNRGLSDHGGGLYLSGTDLRITDNLIEDNETGVNVGYGWGGGAIIYGGESRARLYGNVYTNNYAPLKGSGLFVDDEAIVTSENELFYTNTCNRDGGVAVYVDGLNSGSQLTMINATVADNDCPAVGTHSAFYVEKSSTLTIRNSILWGNGNLFDVDGSSTLSVSYSLLSASQGGEGNLTGDPLFANMAGADFHLRSAAGRYEPGSGSFVQDATTSPAIDKAAPGDAYDQEPTPNGGRRNLGHTGNTSEASQSP